MLNNYSKITNQKTIHDSLYIKESDKETFLMCFLKKI